MPFYISALDTRGAAVCNFLTHIARVQDGAVLFDCTAGKDRTGIIAALLLGLAGVSDDDIVDDYVLTEQMIPNLVARISVDLARKRRRCRKLCDPIGKPG